MKTIKAVADELGRRFRNRHQRWLAGDGTWPMPIKLDVPTQVEVERNIAAVKAWATEWSTCRQPGEVVMQSRRWGRIGEQTLPVALVLANPIEAAAWSGQSVRYARAAERFEQLRAHWAHRPTEGLERQFDVLADYDDEDFTRLVRVVDWLLANPASGLYLRQLPIEGVDTKWIAPRRGVIVRMLAILRGAERPDLDFNQACGLRAKPAQVRMRVLCPALRERFSGVSDIVAPIAELARLDWTPAHVLIVENLESALALPDMLGAVALCALGWSVSDVSTLSWLQTANVIYWGDIDTHGLAILAHLRSSLPRVSSILMDEATLLAHRSLWATESSPHAGTELAGLTAAEQALFTGLREHRWDQNVRLEQERLAWPEVLRALTATFMGAGHGNTLAG